MQLEAVCLMPYLDSEFWLGIPFVVLLPRPSGENPSNGHVLENMLIYLLSSCYAGYGRSLTQMRKKNKREVNMEVSADHRVLLPSLRI